MHSKISFSDKINFRILTTLLILFIISAIIVTVFNRSNIRYLYEENFTERVLLTNALMAALIDSEDVNYFVDLMKHQSGEFKQRQVQFYHDRQELWAMQEEGASEEEQQGLLDRLSAFHDELASFKNDAYWETVDELRNLKEVSHSTYLYVMADTGLFNNEGEHLYTFIFDAEDTPVYDSPDIDGLGTSDISEGTIKEVYASKKQMEWVSYYSGDYGELYYSYAPIFNKNGDVIAVLGTDLDLGKMNSAIANSSLMFNLLFLSLFVIIILFIFVFLRRSITTPLTSLTNTARELALGNVYTPTEASTLKQRGEIGTLAHAIHDMSAIYQEMISSSRKLFNAANIGKLDVRNDAGKFMGDIHNVIEQINDTLDSMTLYLNSIPVSIFIMSNDLETYFRNAYFISHFGDISASDFISDTLSGDLHKEWSENNQTVWIGESCFSIIFKEIVLSNELDENSILVIAVDITDLMNEKENAQAAAKAKSDFLSRMSHEMRTPMNAIIGMAKIADTTDDVPKLKHCLSTIGISSGQLLGIINDVLDMSKIEAGKFELENVPMNIEKTLMNVCNMIIDKMEGKNQKFNVVLSKDLHLNYIADDLRLAQVITNLLSNAVKFTPEGGKITLAVENTGQKENTNTLRFSVSDTGIGMTSEQLSRLFNAFEQADGSVTRRFGGTGLGLAISKNIVEKMGGRIWAESEPNVGSIFNFEVNLECTSHQDTVIFDGIRPEDIKLLIVESDEDVKKRFLNIIENFGIRTDSASNVEETLALVGSNRAYDIIFLDYDMPSTNGIDLVNRLNGMIDRNTVIIVTTYLEWHQIEKIAAENNVTHYITKPIFPSAVLDAINEVIGTAVKSLAIKTETAASVPDLSDVSVILAEDVEINREIFLALLEETKISVDIAENGAIAVEMFKENPDKYNLIIMDIQMPEMDGYQATRIIRALDIPKAKTIPIIAMTANAFKEDIFRCLEAGMDDHLPKPIDEKAVIEKILYYSKR